MTERNTRNVAMIRALFGDLRVRGLKLMRLPRLSPEGVMLGADSTSSTNVSLAFNNSSNRSQFLHCRAIFAGLAAFALLFALSTRAGIQAFIRRLFWCSFLCVYAGMDAYATSQCMQWEITMAWFSTGHVETPKEACDMLRDWAAASDANMNRLTTGGSTTGYSYRNISVSTVIAPFSVPACKFTWEYMGQGPTPNPATWTPYTTPTTLASVGSQTNPAGCQVYVTAKLPPRAQCGLTCNGVGEPVNPANGGMYLTETDVPGKGGAPEFRRFYNSADTESTHLSTGWHHSFSRSIKPRYSGSTYQPYSSSLDNSSTYNDEETACTSGFAQVKSRVANWASAAASYSNGVCALSLAGANIGTLPLLYGSQPTPGTSVIVFDATRDDGQLVSFTVSGSMIVAPPGITLRLQQSGSGYSLTDAADNIEAYDTSGKLISVTSRNGVTQTLSYDGSGRLSSIVDNFGHSLVLAYDPQNRLATVTLPDSHTVQYAFDVQGRLSSATNTDSTVRTYLYEDANFANALTGLKDETNTRLSTWTYDTQGRATSTQEAGGAGAMTLVYNSNGSVTTTDALGAVRVHTFGRFGDRDLVTGISGSQCPTCREPKSTAYDPAGFVTSRTDYNNNVTNYTSDDTRGLETSRTEAFSTPRARTNTTQWHATYRLPTLITETGKTTSYTHDANGNVLTRTVTDTATSTARTWTYTYNGVGQILTADGPRTDLSDVTTYTYYACTTGHQCGQVQTITNALSQVTTYNTYNAYGQPLTITDPNGVVTTLTYDLRQRLISRTIGLELTTFDHWPTGLLKKVTLPDSSYLLYTYDAAHRLTDITDTTGNTIHYTLDAMGNRIKEEAFDPSSTLSRTRSRVFNSLNQLYKEIGAANTAAVTMTFGYDNNGNQTSIAAPLSRNTAQGYDELNRLATVTDPGSGVTTYGYDALDQLISVIDPRSLVTAYTYNALGDLKQQASPDTGTTTNTYDSGGNLKTSTDARSQTATLSYDALNRVTQVAYSDQTITQTYDQGTNGLGRLTGISDASGSTTWTYTSLGRIDSKTQVTGSITKAVGYSYNAAGQLDTLTTPSGRAITYTYANGRIDSVRVNGTLVLSDVLYEPFGPTSGWTWGNGTFAVRTYDTDGDVAQVDSAGLNTYGYDDAKRITSITDAADATRSWAYDYDLQDRLTSASKTSLSQSWTYDANGNRLTQGGTSASTYVLAPTSNRMTSVSGAVVRSNLYDNAGNTTANGTATFTYNAEGRIVSATQGGVTTTYAYNGLGQRVKKSNTSATTYFVYDEAGHLLGEYDASGALIQEMVWMDDTPVATLRWGSCGLAIFYIHTDYLNTPRRITKRSTSDIVWRWDSDPFGTTAPNQNPSGLGVFNFNLRFPGQYYDAETGLNYNMERDYDPQSGRYVESDPIGLEGGTNTYAYALNNPLTFTDPLGLAPGDIFSTREAAEADRAIFAALLDERRFALDVILLRLVGADDKEGGILSGVYQVDWVDETSCSGRFTYDWIQLVTGVAPTPGRSLGSNPFKGKSALEIDAMFREKGFLAKGPNPMAGQGSYVNPMTGRGYHIDAGHGTLRPYPKGPHVGVHRPRNMRDVMPPRDYPMGGR